MKEFRKFASYLKKSFVLIVLISLSFSMSVAEVDSVEALIIPVKSFNKRVKCSTVKYKTLSFNTGRKTLLVEFPFLYTTPIVNDTVVCHRLLETILDRAMKNQQSTITVKLKKKKSIFGSNQDIYTFADSNFLDYCREAGICATDFFGKLKLLPELKSCEPKRSFLTTLSSMKPKLLRPSYSIIKNVDIEVFPFVPFVDKVGGFLESNPQGENYISSMTLGKGASLELKRASLKSTIPSFLSLDAGLMFAKQDASFFAETFSDSENLHILPQTSGAKFKTVHHWKYAVNSVSDMSFITSMNLSTPQRTPFLDLIYNFKSKEIQSDLLSLSQNSISAQCSKVEDFQCLANFSLTNPSPLLRETLDKGCREYFKVKSVPSSSKLLINNQDTSILTLVSDLIEDAETEVVILSHRFTLPKLSEKLVAASERGVAVSVISAEDTQIRSKNFRKLFTYTKDPNLSRFIDPHLKVMLIDRKLLFFGTGNFSQNAFTDAREVFGVTDDKKAIELVLSLFSSYDNQFDLGSDFEPIEQLESSNWLVLDQGKASKARILPLTLTPKQDFLSNYRKLTEEARPILRKCGFSSSLFISEQNFLDCYLKHSRF